MNYNFVVYKLIFNNTDKCYIGFTCNLKKRLEYHRNKVKKEPNLPVYKAYKKYGLKDVQVLFQSFDREEALNAERELINSYNSLTTKNGYNLNLGGFANSVLSEETKQKISKSLTGRKKPPEELKKFLEAHAKRRGIKRPEVGPAITLGKNKKIKATCLKTGKEYIFNSHKECAEQLNIHASSISKFFNGTKNRSWILEKLNVTK